VYYEDCGKGDVIVLLHGFLENSSMWKHLKSSLVKKHRVLCIDLLGHGQTGCLGYIHSMRDMANTVEAVLNHLHIKRYTIIGHSMGGYVALSLAESHTKAISGICLMNSNYYTDDEERVAIRKRANVMAQTNYETLVRMSFSNLFSPESKLAHKVEFEDALGEALKTPLQGYIAAQEGMCVRTDKLDVLKTLKVKKAIIVGLEDPVVDANRILQDTIGTNIVCHQLPFGHMSHIEIKSELTYIINHFVE